MEPFDLELRDLIRMRNRPPPLPNAWNVYNLAGSPYFQDTLEAGPHTSRPLGSLFVGREAELRALRGRVHGAAAYGSRQAVAGIPGVGKTTLVQELKALLFEDGYMTTDAHVPLLPGDTSEALFGRVLGALYDTIVANRPATAAHAALRDAQLLVRASRLAGGGGGVSFAGFGVSASSSVSAVTPRDFLIDGPRVLRDLMRLVRESGAHGVVVHMNNLEVLGEADVLAAAETLRSLRDLLMQDGLHIVLVGTGPAVRGAVNTHAQVRNIFSVLDLAPLRRDEVHALLASRYRYLRLDGGRAAMPPVDGAAVAAIFDLFRGDLRGMLKALEDGASPLLGIAGVEPGGGAPARPLTLDELHPALRERYGAQLVALPEETRVEQLMAWGRADPAAAQTQASLRRLWRVSQPAVSNALKYLLQQGYVAALPREGRQPTRYVLTGTARLIFDPPS
jgi:hypothetical protein